MSALLLAWVLLARPLQPLIDATPEGGTLTLDAQSSWAGPIVLSRPMTLDGRGVARIEGSGHGTVVTIKSTAVVLRGLAVSGSGTSHDQLDAAISVEAPGVTLENLDVSNALFGVSLKGADDSRVCGSTIRSVDGEPGIRGDAIRVWNSHHVVISGNEVVDSRDVSLSNSTGVRIVGNWVHSGRFGVQLVFSPQTRIEANLFDHNLAGIAVLYSNGAVIRGNQLSNSIGPSGNCLTFKDSGQATVEDNLVLRCSIGSKLSAPTNPENVVLFRRNVFAHNLSAFDFYGENGGHVLERNSFERNYRQVSVSAPMSARGNLWSHNAFDDYEGFDRNSDGVGDTPYELYSWVDHLWEEEPKATFFRDSPALTLLDFLERLAPFSQPELTLRDAAPELSQPPPPAPSFTRSCEAR